MKYIFLICLLSITIVAYSQNIIIGTKSYPATKTWILNDIKYLNPPSGRRNVLDVSIGMYSATAGLIMISTSESYSPGGQWLSKSLFVVLKNGKIVLLESRLAVDRADNTLTAVYKINSEQLNLFKLSDIDKIRYEIVEELGQPERFTVPNVYQVYSAELKNYVELSYSTASEVSLLFSNGKSSK